jgi:hydrogenase maturation factor
MSTTSGTGHDLPEIGKISPEIFEEVIYPRLGRRDPAVLVPPQHGVDIGVVDIGGGNVMAVTCDPVFIVPQYGWERSAWFAVHILASDAAVSGLAPRWMTIDLNLPLGIAKDQFVTLWRAMHAECDKLGIAVIAGHTARYQGCDYPMVGGATVMATGPRDGYVTPAMAGVGEDVVITKGPAIEATALLAATFPKRIAAAYGADFGRRADAMFEKMSVVEEATIAAAVGVRERGVTAMHDATECGLWGGLYEVARASRVGMRIDRERIPVPDEVDKVCRLFAIEPFSSISEGTLVLTCKRHRTAELLARLAGRGIDAAAIGETLPEPEGITLVEDGRRRRLEHPRVDPFWAAFGRAMAEGDR